MSFQGFPKETFAFLTGIAAHNEKAWFDANRALYEAGYVAPARAFVDAIGPRLKALSPGVEFEAKVNRSMSRINRDIRFSKDKRPYKDHLDLFFWHGERKGWDNPGFWFRITPQHVYLGCGMYGLEKEALDSFRQSIIHPRSGGALLEAVAKVKAAGNYEIGGKSRKLMPKGFSTEADRAEYLLHEGLTAGTTIPISAAAEPDFVEVCMAHYANTWPVGKWLLDEIGAAD